MAGALAVGEEREAPRELGDIGQAAVVEEGVDRLLDMSRTVVNVTGDLTAAVLLSPERRARVAEAQAGRAAARRRAGFERLSRALRAEIRDK